MFLSRRHIMHLIMLLVGYFGIYYGSTNAEVRGTPIISTVMARLLQSTSSQITNASYPKSKDEAKLDGSFVSHATSKSSSLNPILPTWSLRVESISLESSSLSRAIIAYRTPCAKLVQPVTLRTRSSTTRAAVAFNLTVSPPPSKEHLNGPTELGQTTLTSQHFSGSLRLNSTAYVHKHADVDVDDKGYGVTKKNRHESSDSYVTRWVDFYLNVGGWIMLSIVLVGITVLTITYIHGRKARQEIKGLPQLMYGELYRYKAARWV
ncbi:uncharacterized protein [Montipora foliosa]|uniref:uncharacterized protein isoform X2 n=1 Tax=Montipora foliosa TaxID=591990 RepID=UPI0035F132C3